MKVKTAVRKLQNGTNPHLNVRNQSNWFKLVISLDHKSSMVGTTVSSFLRGNLIIFGGNKLTLMMSSPIVLISRIKCGGFSLT